MLSGAEPLDMLLLPSRALSLSLCTYTHPLALQARHLSTPCQPMMQVNILNSKDLAM